MAKCSPVSSRRILLAERGKIDTTSQSELPVTLIIDDDPVAGEIAAAMLAAFGCTVHLAEDGHCALTLLDSLSQAPDTILVDAQLPGLSGTSLIAALRARGVSHILSISASAPPAAMASATDGFLRKPFDSDELMAAVGFGNHPETQPADIASLPKAHDADVLSPEVLKKFRQKMSEDSVLRIYTALIDDTMQRIGALERAIGGDDMDEARRIAHLIQGGGSMAGAQQLAALGAQLEAIPISACGSSSESANAILCDLRAAIDALEGKLKAEFPA